MCYLICTVVRSYFGTWNSQLLFGFGYGTQNLELGTRNLELATWNSELGIWNLEFGIWNLELQNHKLATPPTPPMAREWGIE